MPSNPYTFILDQIRKGVGQVASFRAAERRFKTVDRDKIYRQWLTAWGGKYTADLWASRPDDPLRDFLDTKPTGKDFPGLGASRAVIQSWFSTIAGSPYDFNTLYNIVNRANKQYGQWRYEPGELDTYKMAIATADGTLIKEYLRKNGGKIEFLNHWFIANSIKGV